MHNKIIILLCLFFSLPLLGGCESDPQIAELQPGSVILAFGDSLTHGTGASTGQSYPDVLSDMLGSQVINAGIPGEVSSQGLKRLPAMLEKYQPSLVILCHGGNDFLRRLDQNGTVSNLKAMIELIQRGGADVILVGVPKLGFGLDIPKFYNEIAEQYALPIENEILIDLLGDKSKKSDAIHPNAVGYRLMAEALYKVIDKAQKK